VNCEVDVINEQAYPVKPSALAEACRIVVNNEQVSEICAITIVITDDETITRYNTQYRDVAAPTDILSFPAELPDYHSEQGRRYLGDLMIAYPYTRAEAAREGHDLDAMLSLMAIHGTLHLLGYDHDTDAKRAAMWAAQARALMVLGIPEAIANPTDE
jgi:probable rRNA maturation factor